MQDNIIFVLMEDNLNFLENGKLVIFLAVISALYMKMSIGLSFCVQRVSLVVLMFQTVCKAYEGNLVWDAYENQKLNLFLISLKPFLGLAYFSKIFFFFQV